MPARLEKAGVCLCKHLLLYGSNRDKIFIRTLSSFRLVGEISVVKKDCPNHGNLSGIEV